MSIKPVEIDEATRAAVDRGLDLMSQFLSEIIDDPNRLEQLPESAVLIVLDPDNPQYNEDRLTVARNGIGGAQAAYAWRLNAADPDHAAFPVLDNEP